MKKLMALLVLALLFMGIGFYIRNDFSKCKMNLNAEWSYDEMYSCISDHVDSDQIYLTSFYSQEFYIEYIDGELARVEGELSVIDEKNKVQVFSVGTVKRNDKNYLEVSLRKTINLDTNFHDNVMLKEFLESVSIIVEKNPLILDNQSLKNFTLEFFGNRNIDAHDENIGFVLFEEELEKVTDHKWDKNEYKSKIF